MNIINDNFQNKKNDYFQVDTEGFWLWSPKNARFQYH
jgi:hypothetical protein